MTAVPKLKAKGAATRHLAPYVLSIAIRMDDGSRFDRMVVALCQLYVRFYQILNLDDQFLSDDFKAELGVVGRKLCMLYAGLCSECFQMGIKLFKMTPKLHLVLHLCEWVAPEWGNPSYYWCYADEDLVGLMIELAESCHINTLAVTALVKWLVLAFDVDEA